MTSNTSSDRLIETWRAGVERDEMMPLLYERYASPVARFFANRGFTGEECQDLTQETFLNIYRHLDRFRGDSGFNTWVFAIARNVWRNARRDRGRQKRSGDEVPLDQAPPSADRSPGPLAHVLIGERHRLLRNALDGLPRAEQHLVLLRLDQGMKYREIADLMRLPLGTVKSKLAKAHRRLRERLGDEGRPIAT